MAKDLSSESILPNYSFFYHAGASCKENPASRCRATTRKSLLITSNSSPPATPHYMRFGEFARALSHRPNDSSGALSESHHRFPSSWPQASALAPGILATTEWRCRWLPVELRIHLLLASPERPVLPPRSRSPRVDRRLDAEVEATTT